MSDRQAAGISAHLADCARCASVDARLASVPPMLASVPAPQMPDRVARRLMAALAAESAARAGASGEAAAREPVHAAGQADPPRPARSARHLARSGRRRRPRGWSRTLALPALAATGVLVLIAVGGLLLGYAGGHRTPVSSGTPRAAPSRHAPSAEIDGNAPAGGVPVRYRHAGGYATATAVASAADYTRSGLASGVRKEVASMPDLYPGGPPTAASNRPLRPSASRPVNRIGGVAASRLAGCLSKVAGNRRVLLAEVAHYLDAPVTIVVLRPVGNLFTVIVTGLGCTASNADVIVRLSVPQS